MRYSPQRRVRDAGECRYAAAAAQGDEDAVEALSRLRGGGGGAEGAE